MAGLLLSDLDFPPLLYGRDLRLTGCLFIISVTLSLHDFHNIINIKKYSKFDCKTL